MTQVQGRILLTLGCAVGLVAVLTAVVLSLGSAGANQQGNAPAREGSQGGPPAAAATPTPAPQVTVRTTDVTNVRSGPGTSYERVTQLQPGQTARAVARNQDGTWLLLDLDGGGDAETWVSAEVVEVSGNVTSLPVRGSGTGGGNAAGGDAREEGTDLFIGSVTVNGQGNVVVLVGNRGPGAAAGSLTVRIQPDSGAAHEESVTVNIPAGELRSVTTGYRVTRDIQAVVTVDPAGALDTVNPANNSTQADLLTP